MRLLLAVVLVIAGCESPERLPSGENIAAQLHAAVERGPGTVVSLDSVVPGSWRRVYLFGPYTPVDRIAECLDVRSARQRSRGIEYRDDVNLLIFEDGTQRYQSVGVPRVGADFGPSALGVGYAKGEARFLVQTPPRHSWGDLVPMETLEVVCDSAAGGT